MKAIVRFIGFCLAIDILVIAFVVIAAILVVMAICSAVSIVGTKLALRRMRLHPLPVVVANPASGGRH